MASLPQVSALDRKLLRDLWRMRGQVLAVAMVALCGVATFVTMRGSYEALLTSQHAYYERYRFADVFASVRRAPLAILAQVRAIPGVNQADGRVVFGASLDVPGLDEPASGRLVSLAPPGESARALAREAALRVRRASSDLQLAASERARVEKLVADRFVSPQAMEKVHAAEAAARAETDAARARELAAQADIRSAEAALIAADSAAAGDQRPLALKSPVAGYVLKVHEKSERTVPAGTPLVSVGDPAAYEIVVDVLSTDAVKIRPGQTMWLDDWGGSASLRAVVRLVEPVAFTNISALGVEEQRVNVIARPVDNLGPLGDGYRVEARVVIWEGQSVKTVPGSSLFRVGDDWHVFVVEDGRIRERAVAVGQRNQDRAEVDSGLPDDAVVVRFPGNQMKDGMRVEALH